MLITKGTILIENGTILPDSLLLNREPYSMNWTCASHLDGHGLGLGPSKDILKNHFYVELFWRILEVWVVHL